MLPSISLQPKKLTDVSCVKDSRLLRLPVVVEQGTCVGVSMDNFPRLLLP